MKWGRHSQSPLLEALDALQRALCVNAGQRVKQVAHEGPIFDGDLVFTNTIVAAVDADAPLLECAREAVQTLQRLVLRTPHALPRREQQLFRKRGNHVG